MENMGRLEKACGQLGWFPFLGGVRKYHSLIHSESDKQLLYGPFYAFSPSSDAIKLWHVKIQMVMTSNMLYGCVWSV